MSQTDEYDMNSKQFSERQLPQFNPFRIVKIVTQTLKSPKTGKDYTRYVVSVSPVRNPNVVIETTMFKTALDGIRAILTMNAKAAIEASLVPITGTNRVAVIYSGSNTP